MTTFSKAREMILANRRVTSMRVASALNVSWFCPSIYENSAFRNLHTWWILRKFTAEHKITRLRVLPANLSLQQRRYAFLSRKAPEMGPSLTIIKTSE
ncbi:hypothetical protein AVEN_75910-1 [Araneus ventricosus]|uniref:Uncharacterized protein n=1 Tax=Araneus ventricosus TaxID=182803 RepID=A0A4Y2FSR4_ARAVE|nr:hypothetical protein AVEN_75910-1 [Araneus ventricosus]